MLRLSYPPDWYARAIFFALVPTASVGGGLGLPVLLGLAGVFSFRPSLLRQVFEIKPLPLLTLLAFLGWTIASTAWTSHPAHTQALKLGAIALFGLIFVAAATADAQARRLTWAAGLAAFLILALSLAVEAIGGLPLNRAAQPAAEIGDLGRNVSRGATILLAMTWAGAAGLLALGGAGRRIGAVAVLGLAGLLTSQFGQFANTVAFAGGLLVFGAAFRAPRFVTTLVTGGLAAWVLAAPFATPLLVANRSVVDALPLSWAARAGIWDYVCRRIWETPWFGHGLDAARDVTDRIQVRELNMRAVPIHPHSASLQIWYETGVVGAALAAVALVVGGRWLGRRWGDDRPAIAAATATMASLGFVANVSFGAWQEWWDATLFIAAALVGAVVAMRQRSVDFAGPGSYRTATDQMTAPGGASRGKISE